MCSHMRAYRNTQQRPPPPPPPSLLNSRLAAGVYSCWGALLSLILKVREPLESR
jgi:hypothetical protein